MMFCDRHWEMLKSEIDQQNLSDLIAPDTETIVAMEADYFQREERTKVNFDPMMFAFWNISSNVFDYLSRAGGDPMYLLASPEADIHESHTSRKSWLDKGGYCPVCEISLLHEEACNDPRCTLTKENGYDWMIERGAEEARNRARELELV